MPEEVEACPPQYVAGLDWASDHHDVCVLDAAGRRVAEFRVAHTATGLAEARQRLARLGPAAAVRIALERPSGLLVDTLLEAGYTLVPIHPNALKASRPRYTSVGAKSDALDAYILADLLRTDGHRFRALVAPSDATRALRAAVRTRDDLVATRVQLANQLGALLETFWPGAAAIFADVASPIALAFLDEYPTPDHAARLGEQRLSRFLTRHQYSGRRPAADLLARLRAAPAGHAGAARSSKPRGGSCACSSAYRGRSWPSSRSSTRSSPPTWRRTPTGRSSRASRAPAASTPRRSSPNSATTASASPRPTNSPPRRASPR